MASKAASPFVKAVVKYLANNPMDNSASRLRIHLIGLGIGKHPAAVAMHLTKLGWKGEYVETYTNHNERYYLLTSDGRELADTL